MGQITTIALLERKPTISRDLFSRYWRDVHGVMAARIPGFESYVQHHVVPLPGLGGARVEPFEGIALVRFATAGDRAGLVESEITRHIHRDEQNVFRRALLYNLEAADSSTSGATLGDDAPTWFVVVPQEIDDEAIAERMLRVPGLAVERLDLRKADPGGWNDTDVEEGGSSRVFTSVFVIRAEDVEGTEEAIAKASAGAPYYRTENRFVLVDKGCPTALGLRGLDAVRTIEEAGAVNQLDPIVSNAIFKHLSDRSMHGVSQ